MRIALYSHDTCGLGHFRRCLKLAWALTERLPPLEGVFLSGSPWTDAFLVPPGFRIVHLPAVVKLGQSHYAPRNGGDIAELVSRRTSTIRRVLAELRPDLFLVDNVPVGLHGEVRAALGSSGVERPTSILLLRDILDEPQAVTSEWRASGAREAIEDLFEEVWCFGDSDDVAELRDKGPLTGITKPIITCGHLGWRNPAGRSAFQHREERAAESPRSILVTTGGGADGAPLVKSSIRAARSVRRARWSVVLGPDFPARAESRVRAAAPQWIEVQRFVPDLDKRFAEVDLVVSMAGYNTVCEILASGCPALLSPRTIPRREQLIRAERLERRGRAILLRPRDLRPARLAARIEACLTETRRYPSEALPGGWVAAERARRLLGLEGQRKAG